MVNGHWSSAKNAPFSELLRTVEAYYHPESAEPESPRSLRRHVQRFENEGFESPLRDIPRFLRELRSALADPSRLPEYALENATDYLDENDAEFLARVWHDIYPDRPLPTA